MQKKIGILEVCQPTHYSVVNGLMKAYAWDKNCIVYLFVMQKVAVAIQENGLPVNAELINYDEKDSLKAFLKNVETYQFDRFHLCTVSNPLSGFFVSFKPQCREYYFHVHNVEELFNDKVSAHFDVMREDLKNKVVKVSPVRTIYRFGKAIIFGRNRRRILANVYAYQHQFIVHSDGVKQFLARFVPAEKITVFPFAIYEHMADNSVNNTRVRICVPGIVNNIRRDYDSLFRILEENAEKLRGKITIDLLGYIPKEELHFVDIIKSLQNKGIDIIYYLEFVFGKKYDDPLSASDIVLGNLRVEKSSAQKYGQTKESGTVYNMVRGAKPGLLPRDYPLDQEFHSSSLLFDDYDNLGEILVQLANDPSGIAALKGQAKITSEQFSPASLFRLLMLEKVNA